MTLDVEHVWIAIGLLGQLMFTGRFLVQWLASERAKNSITPVAFWYLSMAGGLVLLAYAIWRRDPVIILGQVTGVFIYGRNLWLIHKASRAVSTVPPEVQDDQGRPA